MQTSTEVQNIIISLLLYSLKSNVKNVTSNILQEPLFLRKISYLR